MNNEVGNQEVDSNPNPTLQNQQNTNQPEEQNVTPVQEQVQNPQQVVQPQQPVVMEQTTEPTMASSPTTVQPTSSIPTPEQVATNNVIQEQVAPPTGLDLGLKQGEYGVVADEPVMQPKKKFPIGILIIIIVLILGLGGGAVWYFMASSPKNIIKNVITNSFKEVNNAIDEYDKFQNKFEYKNQGLLLKGKIKVDSNAFETEEYKDLEINPKDYYFGLNAGMSPKDKTFLLGGSIEGNKNKINIDTYYENKKLYIISELFDNPLVIDLKDQMTEDQTQELNEVFDSADEMFNQIMEGLNKSTIKTEDVKYISNAIEKSFINSLDDKKMSKTNETIEVDGKSIKANKIVYELDKENLKRTLKSICDSLLNDEKFIKALSSMTAGEESEVKDFIKQYKSSVDEIELDKSIYLNIYTTGLTNKFAGIDIEKDNKKPISYYIDDKKSEITIKDEENIIVINITEDKTNTTIVGRLNSKEFIKFNINTKDKEAIDFTATITYEEIKSSIEVYLKNEISKSTIKTDFRFKVELNDTNVSLEGNAELIATDDKLNTENLNKAKDINSLTNSDIEKITENFEKATKDDEALTKIFNIFKAKMEEFQKQNQYYSGNGSKITCVDSSDAFTEKYVISYDDILKEISDVTIYAEIDTSKLSATEAASLSVSTLCTSLKASDPNMSTCTASSEGNILKATVKYENSYLTNLLKENLLTADLNGVNTLLTSNGQVCTLNQ